MAWDREQSRGRLKANLSPISAREGGDKEAKKVSSPIDSKGKGGRRQNNFSINPPCTYRVPLPRLGGRRPPKTNRSRERKLACSIFFPISTFPLSPRKGERRRPSLPLFSLLRGTPLDPFPALPPFGVRPYIRRLTSSSRRWLVNNACLREIYGRGRKTLSLSAPPFLENSPSIAKNGRLAAGGQAVRRRQSACGECVPCTQRRSRLPFSLRTSAGGSL